MEQWNDHAHGARFIPTVFSTFNQEKAAAAVAIKEDGLNRETGLEKCGSPKVVSTLVSLYFYCNAVTKR